MGRRISTTYIALAAIGGFVAIVAVDHYVLKGKLGIAGTINRLIGMLKFKTGQQSQLPIEPAVLPEEGLGPSLAQETPEQFAAEMEMEQELDTEPETAVLARMRARRSAYYGKRRRIRLGGYGV